MRSSSPRREPATRQASPPPLHQACRQVIHEGGRQADDPAVRLISLQLAFITNVGRVLEPADYARLIETCRARAAERGNSLPA